MKAQFRFYSDTLGFIYFIDLNHISHRLTADEFTNGNLDLLCNAVVIQQLDVKKIAEELY